MVLNLLGKGGFACVYRAQCKSTGLEVAIKMVRPAEQWCVWSVCSWDSRLTYSLLEVTWILLEVTWILLEVTWILLEVTSTLSYHRPDVYISLVCTNTVCRLSHLLQIDKKLMQASNMIERVRKEVEIHSRLKHPAILEVRLWSTKHWLVQCNPPSAVTTYYTSTAGSIAVALKQKPMDRHTVKLDDWGDNH